MGLLSSLRPHRRGAALSGGAQWQWSFLDAVWAVFLVAVVVFLALVFTPRRAALSGAVPPCAASEVDLLPCEDPRRSSRLSREMNYYRERHCPARGEASACLVPPPQGYRVPVPWPESLHKIWHGNMPYGKIAERKGHQGWMKQEGSYFVFPGGGTMFPDGAEQYIEKLTQYVPLKSGLLRTGLDMGCGVASFGGFLLKENITTLSFAPRDSHKSQIQFALERGIPAFLLMLGTRHLPFPAQSFDFVHCSRCLIPFTAYNGSYLIEVDRVLRPGGYLIISGPPVKWKKQEKEWGELQAMTQSLCYKLITVDGNTAIWKKPNQASCLPNQNEFGLDLCSTDDDPDEAWYFKLKKCISKVSLTEEIAVGSIDKWPERLSKPSARVSLMDDGASLFEADTQKWVKRVSYYKTSLGVKLGTLHIRNAMDMNAFFGGFAAAVSSDPVWVMNVVPAKKTLTLGAIYDRGLIGVYHDWCEPFSTYPRTYDLIHADGINSLISDPKSGKSRCDLFNVMLEMDRILRPEGTAVIRDSPDIIDKAVQVAHSIRWTTQIPLISYQVGNGAHVLFWRDRWLQGRAVRDIAPEIIPLVCTRKINSRTVEDALEGNAWLDDLSGVLSQDGALQCALLWREINLLDRDTASADVFSWPWSSTGCYTAKSTYKMLTQGTIRVGYDVCVWKSWATPTCKIFIWLALKYRIWTSDRRVRHGLQDSVDACQLCDQVDETTDHLLLQCVFSRQVWFRCFQSMDVRVPPPRLEDQLEEWWLRSRMRVDKKDRRRFDTLVAAVCWGLWKQRNARVFGNVNQQCNEDVLAARVLEDMKLWSLARKGFGVGVHNIPRE